MPLQNKLVVGIVYCFGIFCGFFGANGSEELVIHDPMYAVFQVAYSYLTFFLNSSDGHHSGIVFTVTIHDRTQFSSYLPGATAELQLPHYTCSEDKSL